MIEARGNEASRLLKDVLAPFLVAHIHPPTRPRRIRLHQPVSVSVTSIVWRVLVEFPNAQVGEDPANAMAVGLLRGGELGRIYDQHIETSQLFVMEWSVNSCPRADTA